MALYTPTCLYIPKRSDTVSDFLGWGFGGSKGFVKDQFASEPWCCPAQNPNCPMAHPALRRRSGTAADMFGLGLDIQRTSLAWAWLQPGGVTKGMLHKCTCAPPGPKMKIPDEVFRAGVDRDLRNGLFLPGPGCSQGALRRECFINAPARPHARKWKSPMRCSEQVVFCKCVGLRRGPPLCQ